jgi:hypothetical protein
MNLKEIEFEEFKEGLGMVTDDISIIDYVSINHGNEILKSFDQRPENTGVALFFDKSDMKDMVMVIRTTNFNSDDANGLLMFVLFDAYKNVVGKEALIHIINESYQMSEVLGKSVIANIEAAVLKSIELNA